ncbi:MAG: zeta toxin family protein [Paludibacteraceae bacterium]|nr:zeta toxin family protein [Candidatus Physcocola equi]MCQ2234061.1 zeta toxin family protein [Paludibacteraceae bacterium]
MEQHKPVLIVIAGPNGSGKTTITKKVLRHEWLEDCVYINPDNIAKEVFGDWNSADAVLNAAKYATELREKLLEEKKSMIFETVLSAEDKVDFMRRAKDAGFFIRLFFISTKNPTINAARIANRVMEGGHDVPITKIVSRYTKSIVNCAIISSFIDRTYIYDNSIDGTDAKLLFRIVDGSIYKKYQEDIPSWAKQIFDSCR